jgi:hypothetical protein
MRLLLVFPGALYSTIDVAQGYGRAFKRMADIKLFTMMYHKNLTYHDYAQKLMFGKDFNQDDVVRAASKDLLVRILECRPDWVLFVSGIAFPTFVWDYVKQLQADLKRPFKTAVLLTESPYVEEWEKGILERVDCAFTMDYGIIDDYKQINPNIFYVRHAYDPEIQYPGSGRPINMFFVGTGFPERQRLLEGVDWTDIGLELYGNWMYNTNSKLTPFLRGENLENVLVADKYRESKLSLNIFRTVQWPDESPKFIEPNKGKSLSPRCYEAMACGSVLFTDWREELETLPSDSYALWGGSQELEEKARWLLAHDEERNRIAENGVRAVEGQTFDARALEVLEKLKEQ